MLEADSNDDPASGSEVPDEILRQVDERVTNALAKWIAETGATLDFDRWITPGRSGALLATVVLTLPGRAALGVLMKICPPGRMTGKEADRHADALASNSKFAAAHLVTQPVPPVAGKGGWTIMFQEVAGGSLRTIRPLSAMRSENLPSTATTIVRSILSEWNPQARNMRQGPVQFFREQLGTRIDRGGPLDHFTQQISYAAVPSEVPPHWVRISSGDTVPNALSWASSDSWEQTLGTEHLMVLVGCAHGDLHADNILLPQKPLPDPKKYRLIDLAAYDSDAPLARDPSHLLLSMLVDEVAELTEVKRQTVSEFLIDPTSGHPRHLQVTGLIDLIKDVTGVGEGFANALGLLDHWQDQTLLSLAANALLFAMRLPEPSMQQWCLELSCAALGRYCSRLSIPAPDDAPFIKLVGSQGLVAVDTARAFDDLAVACSDWAATRITILIVDSARLTPEARGKISALRWKVVVDLNPSTDVDGGWASAAGRPGDRRLVAKGQDPIFGRSSTVWIAAAGLSDADPVDPGEDLRRWRNTHFRFVSKAIEAVAHTSSHPATVVCMGEPQSAERAVVEACVDAFGERVGVVVVSNSGSGVLREYGADTLLCDPNDLLEAATDKSATPDTSRAATLPGHDGPVVLENDLIDRYADTVDLLHSEVGIESDRDLVPGAFYKGRPITWYELNLGLDVDRRVTSELVNDILRPGLKQRNTLRVTLAHTPGAGGTTIARRAAWDLKDEYPTMCVRGDVDESVFAQAVGELAQLCDTSVLVVAELVPNLTLRNVFEVLRASTVPAVLLTTARRSGKPGGTRQAEAIRSTDRYPRSIHVGELAHPQERHEMARRFVDLVPQRSTELFELAARPSDNNVPFFYALTAFGAEFEGLQSYVAQFLGSLRAQEREVIILISMCHRFCGVAVPAELFAELLDNPPSAEVDLGQQLASELSGLLVEEPKGAWRSTHSLIAEEILRQLLTPNEGTPGREDWKASLPGWSLRLIDHAEAVFGHRLPSDMKSIIDRLFTTRESRDPTEAEGFGNTTYTDLMEELTSSGRLQILKALVSAFPEEPHYWAHLGRLLSYDTGNLAEALQATDRAIALSSSDPLLHHMRGMVFRNEMRAQIRERDNDGALREVRVLDLCQSADDAFRKVSELDDSTEYGHIALAQANIEAIEFGYRLSGSTTYALFFARPTTGRYRDLLAEAEESLEAAHEIRGSDRASLAAETAEIKLTKFYDDYSALLQGWRNLLDRADLAKPLVRRQLARAYRNRAGSWRKAPPKDVGQAVILLQQNLLDNPRDTRSLLEWLWAARFTGASLDQAADLVSGWARTEGSREALFYDYLMSYLLVMDGQHAAITEYERKLERCRERAAWFGNRRFAYEWLGEGSGLGRLVHHSDLTGWERRSGAPAPSMLVRVPGRVQSITKATVGTIDFGHGLHAFVVPSASDLLRGRDENTRVTALVAFRYDGPMAFNLHKTN